MQDGAEEESVLDSMSKRELTLLWNALGLSARHQAQELDHLRRDLRQVVTAKLQYVRTACDRFMQDIEVLQQEVQALRQQLYRDEEQRSSQQYDLDTSGALIDRLVALTVERDCLRKIQELRQSTLKELNAKIVQISASLGECIETQLEDTATDLCCQDLDALQAQLEVKQQQMERIVTTDLATDERDPSDQNPVIVTPRLPTQNDVNVSGLEQLAETTATIRSCEPSATKRARIVALNDLRVQIIEFWECLSVPETNRERFLNTITGIGPDAITAVRYIELKRLKEATFELVKTLRTQIRERWDQLAYDEESRTKFGAMNESFEEMSGATLQEHKKEMEILDKRLEMMKPILKFVSMRESILQDRRAYERSVKDPNRLISRRVSASRLLFESKLRARIEKDLPKITAFLERQIPSWEARHAIPFLWKGQSYLELMHQMDREYEERTAKPERVPLRSFLPASQCSPQAPCRRRVSEPPAREERTPLRNRIRGILHRPASQAT